MEATSKLLNLERNDKMLIRGWRITSRSKSHAWKMFRKYWNMTNVVRKSIK